MSVALSFLSFCFFAFFKSITLVVVVVVVFGVGVVVGLVTGLLLVVAVVVGCVPAICSTVIGSSRSLDMLMLQRVGYNFCKPPQVNTCVANPYFTFK